MALSCRNFGFEEPFEKRHIFLKEKGNIGNEKYVHNKNNGIAAKVPMVPGALGLKPLPNPNAKK